MKFIIISLLLFSINAFATAQVKCEKVKKKSWDKCLVNILIKSSFPGKKLEDLSSDQKRIVSNKINPINCSGNRLRTGTEYSYSTLKDEHNSYNDYVNSYIKKCAVLANNVIHTSDEGVTETHILNDFDDYQKKCSTVNYDKNLVKECIENKWKGSAGTSSVAEVESEGKIIYDGVVEQDKCTLKKVVREGRDWEILNGFDVFSNNPKKYLGHIHGKYESNYTEQTKYAQCKAEVSSNNEVTIKEEFKDCQWVDYQKWNGVMGCKTEKSNLCIGKVVCKEKYYNVVCNGEAGECPSASACASDDKMSKGEDSYQNKNYSTETKVIAQ